jgi:hypothetical protein
MKSSILLALLALPMAALADGLPKDENDNLTVPHTFVAMTPSQVEEMEVLDSVTLTKEQWAEIRKVSPNTPKRLQGILPITWNDCLCCVRCEAVRMKDGKLAIFHEEQNAQALKYRINPARKLRLMVDRRGQFHLDGILVHYKVLIAAIRASDPVKPGARNLDDSGLAEIDTPAGMDHDDPVFFERLTSIHTELAAKGWNGGKLPYWLAEKLEKNAERATR